jgi:hypothetical protein
MVSKALSQVSRSLPLERFWAWLEAHLGCIIQAGSLEMVLHDHEDHHWRVSPEDEGRVLVQMLRGKRPVAEVVMNPAEVAYVQVQPGEREEEFFFDLCDDRGEVVYFFVLSHDFEGEEANSSEHWN